jgi:hypothetical protein
MIKAALALLIGSIAAPSHSENPRPIREALVRIQDIGPRPPFGSGYVATYVELTVRQPKVGARIFYLPHMDETQAVPVVGAQCRFKYRIRRLNGLVGQRPESIKKAAVVDGFDCVN